ncbi:MAG: glucose-1-phosphate adenylyltransferase [Rubrivivax sp.]|nr:glucose-1-phosphate adenylyltransferase [Rubrivivax sp.]
MIIRKRNPRAPHPAAPAAAAQQAAELAHLMQRVYAVVLAGGRGARLHQLTDRRAKPALPFAGKLNIIDFALSNCVNSGIRRIGVLTQYKAQSLIRHIERGWGFLQTSLGEFIDIVPAQQQQGEEWYSGTANAVWQNLEIVREAQSDLVLVLSGDHVYKMDYARLIADHMDSGADATVACVEVPLDEARHFGVMGVDHQLRVCAFVEKPEHPEPMPGRSDRALVSMGIYVFGTDFLCRQLADDAARANSHHDFGRDLLPHLVRHHHVHAHRFADSCVNMVGDLPYWRDVGTIDAYWEANMDLTHVQPALNLYDDDWPILSLLRQVPPAKFVFDYDSRRGMAVDSLVSGGCIVSGATVRRSILFSKVRVAEGSLVEDAVVLPNVRIGRDVTLRRAIVDKGCVLPDGFSAGVDIEHDRRRFHVSERGIVLITPDMLDAPTADMDDSATMSL